MTQNLWSAAVVIGSLRVKDYANREIPAEESNVLVCQKSSLPIIEWAFF